MTNTPVPTSRQTAPADVARFREIASSIVSDMDEPSHFREVYITRITAALAAQRAAGLEEAISLMCPYCREGHQPTFAQDAWRHVFEGRREYCHAAPIRALKEQHNEQG